MSRAEELQTEYGRLVDKADATQIIQELEEWGWELERERDAAVARAENAERERDEARRGWALLAGSQSVSGEEGSGWFRWQNAEHIDESRKWAVMKWPDSGAELFPEDAP